jgi:hypothetical protein
MVGWLAFHTSSCGGSWPQGPGQIRAGRMAGWAGLHTRTRVRPSSPKDHHRLADPSGQPNTPSSSLRNDTSRGVALQPGDCAATRSCAQHSPSYAYPAGPNVHARGDAPLSNQEGGYPRLQRAVLRPAWSPDNKTASVWTPPGRVVEC